MNIVVNGKLHSVPENCTIAGLVASLSAAPDGRGVAVAVGGEVVPRPAWEFTALAEGARVELVAAVQGG
jgi:sulfur carrier protein